MKVNINNQKMYPFYSIYLDFSAPLHCFDVGLLCAQKSYSEGSKSMVTNVPGSEAETRSGEPSGACDNKYLVMGN